VQQEHRRSGARLVTNEDAVPADLDVPACPPPRLNP
jgi:hypothetical protein